MKRPILGWLQLAPEICSHHIYTYSPFKEVIKGQILYSKKLSWQVAAG